MTVPREGATPMTSDLDQKDLKVEIATEADSDDLKKFVIKQPFLTNYTIDLAIDRKGSFFDKYRLQSDDFVTYKMTNDAGEIEGIASMIFRRTLLNGTETLVGYATDLRISNSRQAIVQWPEKLMPALNIEAQNRNCDYVFSIFNVNQTRAMNALIRPRSQRRSIPRYYLYKHFEFITLHGKMPFTDLPFLSTVKMSRLTDNDIEPLAHYLKSKTMHRPLAFEYTPDLINYRLKNWPGFSKDNFIIARDSQKNIVGCVAPWKASQIFNVSVLNYSGFGETMYAFSKWFSLFKFVKKLPRIGETLPLKFLTHFYADNPDIFGALLAEAFRVTSRDELLSYIHFNGMPLTMPPKSFLTSKIPFAMYSVLPAEKQLPEFLQLHKVTPPPEIEPIMI